MSADFDGLDAFNNIVDRLIGTELDRERDRAARDRERSEAHAEQVAHTASLRKIANLEDRLTKATRQKSFDALKSLKEAMGARGLWSDTIFSANTLAACDAALGHDDEIPF